ncbi:hypothetical protein CEXT_593681 [Caerostris extrusa]|uniref:Uncharacterized protein n=1 Tax=Caerostris extrusa TaxID=172846 RepID=A0AAV4VDY6_CAEEX|nr:hypothetical protein CEXT_593681 [Caerostris extrusa]
MIFRRFRRSNSGETVSERRPEERILRLSSSWFKEIVSRRASGGNLVKRIFCADTITTCVANEDVAYELYPPQIAVTVKSADYS